MPASYKTCPPYPAGVVYSLLIGPKTIGLTALTLSLAHAPNRETLPFNLSFQAWNYKIAMETFLDTINKLKTDDI